MRDLNPDEKMIEELRNTILYILDMVDYHTEGHKACTQTEMVGAVLPGITIENARAAVKKAENHII